MSSTPVQRSSNPRIGGGKSAAFFLTVDHESEGVTPTAMLKTDWPSSSISRSRSEFIKFNQRHNSECNFVSWLAGRQPRPPLIFGLIFERLFDGVGLWLTKAHDFGVSRHDVIDGRGGAVPDARLRSKVRTWER